MTSFFEEPDKPHKIIILLGTSASGPAGILIVSEMTNVFLNNPMILRQTFAGKVLQQKDRDS